MALVPHSSPPPSRYTLHTGTAPPARPLPSTFNLQPTPLPQVRELLHKRIRDSYLHPGFQADVMKPLTIEHLMDNEVQTLSGGERCGWVGGAVGEGGGGWGVGE